MFVSFVIISVSRRSYFSRNYNVVPLLCAAGYQFQLEEMCFSLSNSLVCQPHVQFGTKHAILDANSSCINLGKMNSVGYSTASSIVLMACQNEQLSC